MAFGSAGVKSDACEEGESVKKGSKEGKDNSCGEDVVEMGNNVICVMEGDV